MVPGIGPGPFLYALHRDGLSVGGDPDLADGVLIAVDDLAGDGVLQILLDLAAQIAGPIGGGVGLLH